MLSQKSFTVKTKLGFDKPDKVIPKIINKGKFDILVMGTHRHNSFKDLIFGTTVDKLGHRFPSLCLLSRIKKHVNCIMYFVKINTKTHYTSYITHYTNLK